jgi:hypothetical protein
MVRPMEMVAMKPVDRHAQVPCRLCGGETSFQFIKLILNKHEVRYWRCVDCFCLQTDAPHWLAESYRTVHSPTDTGMVARSWQMAQTSSLLLHLAGVDPQTPCLDWGGGNGLFCRTMRDQGYNFINYDKYADPFYCIGFTQEDWALAASDIVTSFEVFEHLPDPAVQLKEILKFDPKIWIFSTQLYAAQDRNWSYLSPELGRHVFFYSDAGLSRFAEEHGYRFVRGRETHMFLKRSGHGYLKAPLQRYGAFRLLAGARAAQLGAGLHFLLRQRMAYRHWRADGQLVREKMGRRAQDELTA